MNSCYLQLVIHLAKITYETRYSALITNEIYSFARLVGRIFH